MAPSHIRLLLLILVCWLIPRALVAQDRLTWPTRLSLGGYAATSATDIYQTATCLSQGRCREANPIARRAMAAHGLTPVLVTKVAVNAGVIAWVLVDRRTHPRRAFAIALFAVGVQTTAVVLNARRVP